MRKRKARKVTNRISQGLAQAIRASGLSPYMVAKQSRINSSMVTRFLNGERGMSLATLDRLAAVLGLELRRLPREAPACTNGKRRKGR